jgi:hypothetical protein
MYRLYLVLCALVVAMLGYAQYQNWSIFGSDALRDGAARSATRGSGSSYSGHK